MNYTVEKLEKSQLKFNYTVDCEAYDKAVNSVYFKTKHKYNVPGFRKGHAPRRTIEGMYGPYVFFSDAVNELVDNAVDELDKSGEYQLVSLDSIDDVDTLDDGGVKFSITLTVKPEVTLGDLNGIGVKKDVKAVSDDDVDGYIGDQQLKQARLVDFDGEAQKGDFVVMDFVGTKDGVPFEGGSSQNYELELGSGTFIPGFEDQLVGVKAGEEREVKVTFPETYGAKELAGKEAIFKCTVTGVKKKELPALDDEFAKDISECSTFEEYKKSVRETLEKDAELQAERAYEDAIAEKVVEISSVDVPESMIERETEDMLKDFEARLAAQGIQLDQYFKYVDTTREKVLEEYKAPALQRIKMRLVMEAIVEKENMQISDDEINAKIKERAELNALTEEEYRKKLTHDEIDYIVNSILSAKLMEFLKACNEKGAAKAPAKKSAKKAKEAPKEETPANEAPASEEKEEPKAEEPASKKKAPAKKTTKKPQTDGDKAE